MTTENVNFLLLFVLLFFLFSQREIISIKRCEIRVTGNCGICKEWQKEEIKSNFYFKQPDSVNFNGNQSDRLWKTQKQKTARDKLTLYTRGSVNISKNVDKVFPIQLVFLEKFLGERASRKDNFSVAKVVQNRLNSLPKNRVFMWLLSPVEGEHLFVICNQKVKLRLKLMAFVTY